MLVRPTWSAKTSSNLKTSSDQRKRLTFFHPDSTSKQLFSIEFHMVAQILCMAVMLLLSKHSPNHQSLFCFVYFTLAYSENICFCNTFFCSLAHVQLQQTVVQTVTDCLETCWTESCLTTADTIYINTLTHTQTVTVKHDEVRPFDLVWLLTAAFYTRKNGCERERERSKQFQAH